MVTAMRKYKSVAVFKKEIVRLDKAANDMRLSRYTAENRYNMLLCLVRAHIPLVVKMAKGLKK